MLSLPSILSNTLLSINLHSILWPTNMQNSNIRLSPSNLFLIIQIQPNYSTFYLPTHYTPFFFHHIIPYPYTPTPLFSPNIKKHLSLSISSLNELNITAIHHLVHHRPPTIISHYYPNSPVYHYYLYSNYLKPPRLPSFNCFFFYKYF
jgi:hypothetical protein